MTISINLTESPPMAKKKAPESRPPGRPPLGDEALKVRLAIRTSKVWMKWLEQFGADTKRDKTTLVRDAFKALAEKEGREMPPDDGSQQ